MRHARELYRFSPALFLFAKSSMIALPAISAAFIEALSPANSAPFPNLVNFGDAANDEANDEANDVVVDEANDDANDVVVDVDVDVAVAAANFSFGW